MTPEEFNTKVDSLKKEFDDVVYEYIDSNKKYSIGDILRISFTKREKKYSYNCKIVNVYLKPNMVALSLTQWPTSTIHYFARYCWKDKESGDIVIGDHCPIGYLEGGHIICGHLGIDMDTLKIEVIGVKDL